MKYESLETDCNKKASYFKEKIIESHLGIMVMFNFMIKKKVNYGQQYHQHEHCCSYTYTWLIIIIIIIIIIIK